MELVSDTLTIYPQISQRTQIWDRTVPEGLFTGGSPQTPDPQTPRPPQDVSIYLPSEAIIASTIIFEETPEGNVLVPYTVSSRSYLDSKDRTLVDVTKGSIIAQGELLDYSDVGVTLQDKDGHILRIREYDMIQSVAPLDRKGHVITVTSSHRNQSSINITYLMKGVSWKGVYTIVVDVEASIFQMVRFNGAITNQTQEVINTNKTNLISGKIKTDAITERAPMMRMAAMSNDFSPLLPEDLPSMSIGEYTEFTLGPLQLTDTTLADIFTLTGHTVSKIYLNLLGETNVDYGYRFNAPRLLPAGSVYVYSTGKSLVGSFIGSSTIKESRQGDEVILILGGTSSVKVDTVIESPIPAHDSKKDGPPSAGVGPQIIKIKSEIHNRNEVPIKIILRYAMTIPNVEKILCDVRYDRKGDMIEIPLDVNAEDTLEFSCSLKVSQQS